MKYGTRQFARYPRYLSSLIWLIMCFALAASSAYGAPKEDNYGFIIDAESVSEMGNQNANLHKHEKIDIKLRALNNTHFVDMLFVADRPKEAKEVMTFVLDELKQRKQKVNLKMGLVHNGKSDASEFSDITKRLKNQGYGKLHFWERKNKRDHKTMVNGLIAIFKDIIASRDKTQSRFFREPSDAGTKQSILVYVSQNDSKKYPPPKNSWFMFIAFALFVVFTGGLGFAAAGLGASLGARALATAVGLGIFSGTWSPSDSYYVQAQDTLEKLNQLADGEPYQKHINAHEAKQILDAFLHPLVSGYEVWSFVDGAENERYEPGNQMNRFTCDGDWCSHISDEHLFKVVNPNVYERKSLYPPGWKEGDPPPPNLKQIIEKKITLEYRGSKLPDDGGKCLAKLMKKNNIKSNSTVTVCVKSTLCEMRYQAGGTIGKLNNMLGSLTTPEAKKEVKELKRAYQGFDRKASSAKAVQFDIKKDIVNSKDSQTNISARIHKKYQTLDRLTLTYKYNNVYVTRTFDKDVRVFQPNICKNKVNGKKISDAAKFMADNNANPVPFCIEVCTKPKSKPPKGVGSMCGKRRPGIEFIKLAQNTGGLISGLCSVRSSETIDHMGEALTSAKTLFSYGGSRVRLKEVPKEFVSIQIVDAQGKNLLLKSQLPSLVGNIINYLNEDLKKGEGLLVRGNTLYLPLRMRHLNLLKERLGDEAKKYWKEFVDIYNPADPEDFKKNKLHLIVEYKKEKKP